MISKGMSNQQAKIYFQKLVFERMIEDIPSFIEDEIQKIIYQIRRDAEKTAQGDTYTENHTYGDPKTEELHIEEEQVPIADNIARNDSRNGYIELLEEIPDYFYHAMVAMLWSFAETSLKKVYEHGNLKKTNVEYLYDKIITSVGRSDLGEVRDVWANVKEFNTIRNQIIHEGSLKKGLPNVDQEYLHTNLESIYSLLKKTVDAIEEYNKTK